MKPNPAGSAQNPPKECIAKRFDLHIHCEYQTFGVRGEGILWDISLTGARLENASRPVESGTRLHLEVSFFPGSVPVAISAEVVRSTATGFAVRFVHLEERLKRLLQVALPKAASFAEKV